MRKFLSLSFVAIIFVVNAASANNKDKNKKVVPDRLNPTCTRMGTAYSDLTYICPSGIVVVGSVTTTCTETAENCDDAQKAADICARKKHPAEVGKKIEQMVASCSIDIP